MKKRAPSTKLNGTLFNSPSLESTHKQWFIFAIAIGVLLILIFIFVTLRAGKGVGAGEAVYVTETTIAQNILSGQSASLRVQEQIVSRITAVSGDTFEIDLYVNPNSIEVGSVTFQLEYPTDKFTLESRTPRSVLGGMPVVGDDGVHQFWDSTQKISSLTHLARYQFRSSTVTGDIDRTDLSIRVYNLNLWENSETSYGPFDLSIMVIPVPACSDNDVDGYGAVETDIRGCDGSNSVFDCNNAMNTVYPEAAEICDGLDNDCDLATDEDNYGMNDIQRGVCAGPKVCLGSGGLQNSYSVSDSTRQEYVRNNFYDQTVLLQGSREFFPFEEYETPEETQCDQLDNDCDGNIDEGLTGCVVSVAAAGARGLVSSPFGNMFIDYESFIDGAAPTDTQTIDSDDNTLYSRVYSMLTLTGCGNSGQRYCSRTIAGDPGWICWDGVYYIDYGETTGLYLFSPEDNLQILTASTTPNREARITELNDGTITCG